MPFPLTLQSKELSCDLTLPTVAIKRLRIKKDLLTIVNCIPLCLGLVSMFAINPNIVCAPGLCRNDDVLSHAISTNQINENRLDSIFKIKTNKKTNFGQHSFNPF